MSAARDKHDRHHIRHGRGGPDSHRPADEPHEGSAEAAPEAVAHPGEISQALAEKERERVELVDRLQRLAAEFSNYQKRMERRVQDESREAVRSLVLDLLPVIDNFERAIESAEKGHDFRALFDGVRLVHDQLLAALRKHGVEPIEAAGGRFDPEHHEAVAHLPSDEHASGQVIDEVQRGYRFGDRTLRASRVAVSRGSGQDDADGDSGEAADGDKDQGESGANEPR